jgi:hypothetical protein
MSQAGVNAPELASARPQWQVTHQQASLPAALTLPVNRCKADYPTSPSQLEDDGSVAVRFGSVYHTSPSPFSVLPQVSVPQTQSSQEVPEALVQQHLSVAGATASRGSSTAVISSLCGQQEQHEKTQEHQVARLTVDVRAQWMAINAMGMQLSNIQRHMDDMQVGCCETLHDRLSH